MAIIYLEPDDEITSAAARIRRATDDRIAIVLPYGSRLATSRINFRLLAREAAEHGRTVEIVAADASARALAGSAGLVTYPSVSAFESATAGGGAEGRSRSQVPFPPSEVTSEPPGAGDAGVGPVGLGRRRVRGAGPDSATKAMAIPAPRESSPPVPLVGKPPPRPGRRGLLAILAVIVVAAIVLGVAGFLFLPTASIVLVPKSEIVGPVTFVVAADTSITAPDPAGLRVPAKTFTFDLQASDTFQATGKKVTDTPATGNVNLTNCDYQHDARVPAGAIVSTTDGISFTTDADVLVPRAALGLGPGGIVVTCKTGSVGITAVKPGPAGNVPANTVRRIDKSYGVNPPLLVTNPADTTGGTHTETPQVTQADVDGALTALNAKLADAFDAKVQQPTEVPQGTRIFPATKQLTTPKPSVDPATLVNQEVAQFQLGETATGSVIGVDPGPIAGMAHDRLQAKVKEGWTLIDGSEKVDVGEPIVTGTTITFPTSVQARERRTIDRAAVIARIVGLGLPQARTVLAEYGDATVNAWPDWVTTIPRSADRISFTVEDTGSPSPAPSGSGFDGGASPTGSSVP